MGDIEEMNRLLGEARDDLVVTSVMEYCDILEAMDKASQKITEVMEKLENMEEGEACHYHKGPHVFAHIAGPGMLVCKCGSAKHEKEIAEEPKPFGEPPNHMAGCLGDKCLLGCMCWCHQPAEEPEKEVCPACGGGLGIPKPPTEESQCETGPDNKGNCPYFPSYPTPCQKIREDHKCPAEDTDPERWACEVCGADQGEFKRNPTTNYPQYPGNCTECGCHVGYAKPPPGEPVSRPRLYAADTEEGETPYSFPAKKSEKEEE